MTLTEFTELVQELKRLLAGHLWFRRFLKKAAGTDPLDMTLREFKALVQDTLDEIEAERIAKRQAEKQDRRPTLHDLHGDDNSGYWP